MNHSGNISSGRRGVTAAGAAVTHSTDEYGVYAGVPAKKIKESESLYGA